MVQAEWNTDTAARSPHVELADPCRVFTHATGSSGTSRDPRPGHGSVALDEQLFRAWQSGDLEARDVVWTRLWIGFSSLAVGFCRRFCRDQATAKEWASSAIAEASLEIERRVSDGAIAWAGQGQFVRWASAQVIFRCRDQCRHSVRWLNRIVHVEEREDDGSDRLDSLVSTPPRQEEDLVRGEHHRDGLRRFVRELTELRALCRDSPALEEVVDEMRMYLRACLIESLPSGIEPSSFTLDELTEAARPERVEATKTAAYRHIMQRLGIDRNTLYQRMKRIHALRRETARDGRYRSARRSGSRARKEQTSWRLCRNEAVQSTP